MSDEINLATLPPDIIRRIIRMEEPLVNEMRSISLSWNSLVQEFTCNRRNLPSLERAYLFAGQYEKREEDEDNDIDESMVSRRQSEERKLVHMYAILPERYTQRVGVGRWLSVVQNHCEGAVEVKSPPQLMRLPDSGDNTWMAAGWFFAYIGLLITCILLGISYKAAAVSTLLPLISLAFGFSKYRKILEKDDRLRARFTRFFESFSRIEKLVLERLDDKIYANAVKVLGDVHIDHLEVREFSMDDAMLEEMVKLCRKHGIRRVLITVYEFKKKIDFRKFVLELVNLGVQLDVYERRHCEGLRYFRLTRKSWDEMAFELSSKGISIRMATIHDSTFNHQDYRFAVRTHIRCEKIDEKTAMQPLKPLNVSRGFNLR